MKILILGFSVTAEKDGYVEQAQTHADWPDGVELAKIGLGGVHPPQLKYLFTRILEDYAPDAVVFEISTSPFRTFNAAQEQHEQVLQWLFFCLQQSGLAGAMFDLPRKDVTYLPEDWAYERHKSLCSELDLPYRRIELNEALIHDQVHPTAEGKAYYGAEFAKLIAELKAQPRIPQGLVAQTAYEAVALAPLSETQDDIRTFERAGFRYDLRCLPENNSLEVVLPEGHQATGLLFIMGPKSGDIYIEAAEESRQLRTYDQYCYYERVNMANFAPLPAATLTILQSSAVPDRELLKGDKDLGPRLGQIGHVLTDRQLLSPNTQGHTEE